MAAVPGRRRAPPPAASRRVAARTPHDSVRLRAHASDLPPAALRRAFPAPAAPRRPAVLAALLAAIALAGCGSTTLSRRAATTAGGPDDARAVPCGARRPAGRPPPDLALVPDAEPTVEPIRLGGANKPYEMFGTAYVPIVRRPPLRRARPGLVVRHALPRPAHVERRDLQHVRHDGGAPHAADPELRARAQSGQRPRGDRAHQRPRAVPSARIIDLSYTAALKLGLLQGTVDGGGAAAHARRDPGRQLARPAVREDAAVAVRRGADMAAAAAGAAPGRVGGRRCRPSQPPIRCSAPTAPAWVATRPRRFRPRARRPCRRRAVAAPST